MVNGGRYCDIEFPPVLGFLIEKNRLGSLGAIIQAIEIF